MQKVDGDNDIGPGCTVGACSCLSLLAAGALLNGLAEHFHGHWLVLQIVLAYAVGMALGHGNVRVLRRQYPNAGRLRLGCTLLPALFMAGFAASLSIAAYQETLSHAGPGWGKADLVIYQYPPLDNYVMPMLAVVAGLGWVVTSIWLFARPASGPRHSDLGMN